MALFSNGVAFGEEKANESNLQVDIAFYIFEKRAANLIRMHKIAFATLKSGLGF
jgi:hypothetical protein